MGQRFVVLLAAVLAVVACPSKEDQADARKTQCLGFCEGKGQVIKLCEAYCKDASVPDCAKLYCDEPRSNFADCEQCCEVKTQQTTFVLGSCLSKADMSPNMTPGKRWAIWKGIVEQRLEREKKERAGKELADKIAVIKDGGWTISEEDGAIIIVKQATLEGDAAQTQPKLLIRCAQGEAELYLQTGTAVKIRKGKARIKIRIDANETALSAKLAADDDTLQIDDAAGWIAKLADGESVGIRFTPKKGQEHTFAMSLSGLKQALEFKGQNCVK